MKERNDDKKQARDALFKGKEKFHRELANLSFEEKVKIMKQLQKLARSIRARRVRIEP